MSQNLSFQQRINAAMRSPQGKKMVDTLKYVSGAGNVLSEQDGKLLLQCVLSNDNIKKTDDLFDQLDSRQPDNRRFDSHRLGGVGDGYLTSSDFQYLGIYLVKRTPQQWEFIQRFCDADGDGKVSKAEFRLLFLYWSMQRINVLVDKMSGFEQFLEFSKQLNNHYLEGLNLFFATLKQKEEPSAKRRKV
jgi:hypothetical protein